MPRVALVTGSSSGIGAATARALAATGVVVALNSREASRAAGEALAAELPGASYTPADVAREDDVERLVADVVDRHGRLDLLVNNAGLGERIAHDDLESAGLEVWQRILGANLIGPWLLTRAALPHLRRGDASHVINVSSVAGSRPGGSSIPYAVSKAGLDHLTRLLAAVLGPEIRVNAVAPGLIATPRTDGWADMHQAVSAMAPLRRVGTAEEVADAVVAVDRLSYLTGQVVTVDGGISLR